MEDLIRLFFSYLTGIWRYRMIALLIAVAISPVGWVYVAILPDVYSSEARVFVDTDSVLKPLIQGLVVQTDENRRVGMMTRVLFSRENMEQLARMTDMDLRAKTAEEMDELIEDLKEHVLLKQAGPNIYKIFYEDATPELAKRVVQSMLTIFVESNLGSARQDQDSAEQFLQREIKDYERRIIEADRKLKDFRLRNLDFVTSKGDYYERLKIAKDAHKAAQEQSALAEKRYEELEEQVEAVEAENAQVEEQQYLEWLDDSVKDATASLDLRIEELETQIDDMLLKYTDLHPEVQAMRMTMERLVKQREELRAQFIAEQSQRRGGGDFSGNPLYQEMRLRLSEALAEVATQKAQVENLSREILNLQRTVDQVLKLESEQKQLTSDYEILKANHADLLNRLETARLTRQVDSSADTVRFRILDPPTLSYKPSGPNRIALSSMVFIGAITAGMALALLISLLRPVFGDRRQLNEILGIPVLGSINMVWTKRQRRKRRFANIIFASGLFTLISSYVLILVLFTLDIDFLSFLPAL